MRIIKAAVLIAFAAVLSCVPARADFVPAFRGNDTGGIIAYLPDLERGAYREMAANWCARWGRISFITSEHRRYGDYIGFVCIDRPGMIH